MEENFFTFIQGRLITEETIEQITELIAANPSWNRTRLSKELCSQWNWTNARGDLKDMACRSLLLKLESKQWIQLPPRQGTVRNENRNKNIQYVPHSVALINSPLKNLLPLHISIVDSKSAEQKLFRYLLHEYHYLSYRTSVGENIKYLIKDKYERPVSCMLFGAAAWRVADRDMFIGWSEYKRNAHLQYVANNSRFLIFEWVRVRNLASFLLGTIAKRISNDFQQKYGHPLYLLETFVEKDRFRGSCYKAANWIHVGQTQGRSRNDRYNNLVVPRKHIFLYPLCHNFRSILCNPI